ncbi:hypothetical protein Ddc_20502 [Ditylenchus destructor]|nr:hypothetical protein Ddc_20502 [Ditylenchus destructor]
MGAGNGIEVVRGDLDEAEMLVEPTRGFHVVERVQQHAGVARAGRRVDQRLRHRAAQSEAAEGRTDEEALHLAGVRVVGVGDRPEAAAAGNLAVDERQDQTALGRRVFAGQRAELLLEVLEIEVDVQGLRVFAHDQPRFFPQQGRIGVIIVSQGFPPGRV